MLACDTGSAEGHKHGSQMSCRPSCAGEAVVLVCSCPACQGSAGELAQWQACSWSSHLHPLRVQMDGVSVSCTSWLCTQAALHDADPPVQDAEAVRSHMRCSIPALPYVLIWSVHCPDGSACPRLNKAADAEQR